MSMDKLVPHANRPYQNQATGATYVEVVAADGSEVSPGATSIADGADVTQGAIADASIAAGATGSISAKLRKISADIGTLLTQTDGIEGSLTSIDGKLAARANKTSQQTALTASTTETTILAAGGASTYVDLYRLIISNTSATDTVVTIRDDTAGTTRFIFNVKAGATVGFSGPTDAAAPQTATNKVWTAQSSASVSSIQITAAGIKTT